MKKKTLVLFIGIIGLLFISVLIFGSGRPNYGDTHDTCHDETGGYTISNTAPVTTEVNNVSYTVFNITATGSNLFVQVYPDAKDNNQFIIY